MDRQFELIWNNETYTLTVPSENIFSLADLETLIELQAHYVSNLQERVDVKNPDLALDKHFATVKLIKVCNQRIRTLVVSAWPQLKSVVTDDNALMIGLEIFKALTNNGELQKNSL
ncbi:MAG: hypothetical protein KatS3mg087_1305 [Patescibacteria group bacterium]|nr:MAG: hypothetical protein KatS3mg087_1305 [Patescibacteria group bacterium]